MMRMEGVWLCLCAVVLLAVGCGDDSAGDAESSAGLRHGFFAVHLDPGSTPALPDGTPNPARPMAHLDELTALVEAADVHGHALTLMFTAQWATHMASPACEVPSAPGAYVYRGAEISDCLSLIRAFETQGHEIAFHHHPESAPNSWDGYSNAASDAGKAGYLGTVDDLLVHVSAIPAGGASMITSGTTEEYPEGPHSLGIMSARGPTPYQSPESLGDLVSRPCAWSEDGDDVWRFRMRSMGPGVGAELAQAAVDLVEQEIAYTAGFITHAKDVDGALAMYEALFAQLADLSITLEGLSSVASHHPYTSGDPAADSEHACPADEALVGPPGGP